MSHSETKNADASTNAADGAAGSVEHKAGFFRNYMRKKLQPTVFVAACVTIAHLGLNWLDAIDSYALMAVSNHVSLAADDASATTPGATTQPADDAVVVVRIDEQTFLDRYRERLPLDRCALSSQLNAIYDADPHIVIIDLDLSPVAWARREDTPVAKRERDCQERLERALKTRSEEGKREGEGGKDVGVRTVLMKPFNTFDMAVGDESVAWQQAMDSADICFGDAVLPVSYGMTVKYFNDERTIYAEALRPSAEACRVIDSAGALRERKKIDVRAYAKLQPVLTSWTETPGAQPEDYSDEDLTATLNSVLPKAAASGALNRVVFFGAGYGQEDTFLTPVGTLYGVEVHAAAFWSYVRASERHFDWTHLAAFIVDIIVALAFGMIIFYCWPQYFAWRMDGRPEYEHLASMWVAIMLLGLLIAIALTTVLAYFLLRDFGIWLSPIPLAAGMLFESCMAGSIEAAVERLQAQAQDKPELPAVASIAKLSTRFGAVVWVLAIAGALLLAAFH